MTGNPLWENDLIQFARLLTEIRATQKIEFDVLEEAMDLNPKEISKVFDRADKVFNTVKKTILGNR